MMMMIIGTAISIPRDSEMVTSWLHGQLPVLLYRTLVSTSKCLQFVSNAQRTLCVNIPCVSYLKARVDIEGWWLQPSELLVQPIRPMLDNRQLIRAQVNRALERVVGCERANSRLNNGDVDQTFTTRFKPNRISDNIVTYVFTKSSVCVPNVHNKIAEYTQASWGNLLKYRCDGSINPLRSNGNYMNHLF
jgi:hypothetical protein